MRRTNLLLLTGLTLGLCSCSFGKGSGNSDSDSIFETDSSLSE